MNPLLRGIYEFLKILSRFVLALFYSDTTIINGERFSFRNPVIIVSNHPNTLIDAIRTASLVKRNVYFLANYSLFKSAFQNWFFNTFFCIPIKRQQDVSSGTLLRNDDAFARCDEHLGNNGILYIAPEGTSFIERRLRPIKTGTARIALSAEDKKDFNLDLTILPVGLTYSDAHLSGSRMVVNVGEHISLKPFAECYHKDTFGTVRKLTNLIEERMKSLLLQTNNDEEDELLKKLERILSSENRSGTWLFYKSQALLAIIQSTEKETLDNFRTVTHQYFGKLRLYHLEDEVVAEATGYRPGRPLILRLIGLLLGGPLFLYGLLNNFLAVFTPVLIAKKINLYIGYMATVKILSGLFTFPLFYFLQSKLFMFFFPEIGVGWYLLSLPLTAYFARIYWNWSKIAISALRWDLMDENIREQMRNWRQEIREFGG